MHLSLAIPVARSAVLALVALSVTATAGMAQNHGLTVSISGRGLPLSVLLDSAALVRAVAALSVPELPAGVPPLFQVRFDSAGAVSSIQPLFDQIPAAYADPVIAATRVHLKPQAPSRAPVSTHLRVVAGPEPLVDRPPLRDRGPTLRNPGEMVRQLERVATRVAGRGSGIREEYRADLEFLVLTDGKVDSTSVQVVRSAGDAEVDREAVGMARRMRFVAGTVEGIPARLWVGIPIAIKFPKAALEVSAMLDSAALAGAVAGIPMPQLPRRIRPLFRVAFDSVGAVETVEPVFAEIPASYAEPVVAAIRTHLKPRPQFVRDMHTHLRVVGGPTPVVDRPSIAEQKPQLRNGEEIRRMLSEVTLRFGGRTGKITLPLAGRDTTMRIPAYTGSVKLRVLLDGTVDPASIRIGMSTGEAELDREAVRAARSMRFRPATIDGIPVAGWARETMFFWYPERQAERRQ